MDAVSIYLPGILLAYTTFLVAIASIGRPGLGGAAGVEAAGGAEMGHRRRTPAQ